MLKLLLFLRLDKNGILHDELVDPIPHLLKVIIRRQVRWHVMYFLQPVYLIVALSTFMIYVEEDCIPPHIDNNDF